ncbi:hypothetical protein ABNQ39_11210 [Azospirillum sp. A26]|uniref:hypothetical protein n=1 Tax=Azospirillum sp. A26 TaxID=3160607 RepID=UPI003671516B
MASIQQLEAENARLMRKFGDELRTMPRLWRTYQNNAARIRTQRAVNAARRQVQAETQEG